MSFFSLITELEALLGQLNAILSGSDNETVEVNGVTKDSISKAIKDRYSAIQAMVQGRRTFSTKADLDASGAPLEDGLAEVWKDPLLINNGLYGWNGEEYEKSNYDFVSKVAALEYLKENLLDGYEADLTGCVEISDDGFLVKRTTKDFVEYHLPLKFKPHESNKFATPDDINLLQEQISESSETLGQQQESINNFDYLTSQLPITDFESDLCGFTFVTVSEDGFLINGTGRNITAVGHHWLKYIDGCEVDLCGVSKATLDRNGYIISKEEVKEKFLPELISHVAGGGGNAAWVERNAQGQYQLKAFNCQNGQVINVGEPNSNFNPAVDPNGKVLYVRGKNRYWTDFENELPFLPPKEVVCYGDSKTEAGSGYGDKLQSLHSYLPSKIQGVGGQRSSQIAVRTGGLQGRFTVFNNTIPSSGSVPIVTTPDTHNFLSAAGDLFVKIDVSGVVGTLKRNASNNQYTFTRDTAGEIVKTYPNIPFKVLSGVAYNSASLNNPLNELNQRMGVFWFGTNDIGKGDYDEDTVISSIKSAISSQLSFCKRYLVLGVPHMYGWLHTSLGGNETDIAKSELKFSQVESLRNRMRYEFGDFYVDMLDEHINYNPEFITEHMVGGVTYSVLDATYAKDGIHGNDDGRSADAQIIVNNLIKRGWL